MLFKQNYFTIFIYFFGLFSFALSDLFISAYFSKDFIADWAVLKSTIFIFGTSLILGLNMMFIRHELKVKKYFYKFFLHSLISTLLLLFVLKLFNLKFSIAFGAFLFSMNLLFSGIARANYYLALSQIISQLWKIIFFVLLMISFFYSNYYEPIIYIILSFIIPYIFCFYYFKKIISKSGKVKDLSLKKIYSDSIPVFFMLFSLNISLYGDQLILSKFSTQDDVVKLFLHTSSIYPIGLALNGLIAFFIGPYFKKFKEDISNKVMFVFPFLIVFAIFISIISYIFGIIFIYYFKQSLIDKKLALILCATIGFRTLYVLPSAYIGIISHSIILKSYTVFCMLFIAVQFLIMYFLLNFSMIDTIYIVSFSVLINWILRVFFGIYYINKDLKLYKKIYI